MPVSDPVQINDVKSILRSLLISKNSRDVTIQSLNSLYKQMRGTNIPYREFNCTTLENFLSSIPDTLNLQYNRNNQLCAYHVPTQNTAHISALIAKQKKPSKKSKSPFSYRSRSNAYQGQTVRRYSAPQSFMRDHPMQSSSICSNYSYSTLAPSSGLYTASIKKNNTYISHTQTNNVQHTSLQTNPKFFTEQTIYNHGIVEQDKHSTQFINGKPTIVDQYKPPIVDHYKPPIHVITNILEQLKQSLGPNSNCGIRKSDVVTKIKEKIGSHSLYTIQDLNCQLNNLLYMLDIKEDYIYFKDLLENQEKNILSAKIQKLNISDDFGFLPADKSNNVQNNLNNDNEDEESLTEKKNENDIVKKRTKIRLEKLLDKHPEGIWCSELPNLYKTEYNIDLEYHDLGFNNIFEFVAALPDIFIVMEPPNTNRQMVISAKRNENADFSLQKKTLASVYNFHDYTAREREPVPDKLSSEVSKKLIPEGVMNFNDTIDQILVSSFSGEDCIEVNVSEIFTPSFFWITLRKNKKKFKEMMSDLEIFYESQDLDVYRIPQLLLKSGLNVACVYANVWHRGIIKKMKPDGYAVILFYDFGTIKSYHPQNLYFLNKRFSTLPAQAIPCGLHNIKPVNGTKEWSAESTNMFNSKVWNLPLIAITLSTDDKNNSMMITLTDTSDDIIDLHINDWMVENGLAEWGKMVCIKKNFAFQNYCDILQKQGQSAIPKKDTITFVQTNYYVSLEKKMTALRRYKSSSYQSSEFSSESDELVFVYNDKIKDEKKLSSQRLFNRYKALLAAPP